MSEIERVPTPLERGLAELIKRFRQAEIEPLRRRVDQIERELQIEKRLAALEARAGLDPVERHLIRPEHTSWRNGGGR
jgi:hypothetical protein